MSLPDSPAAVRSAERVLTAGTWSITAGAVLFSVLTVTPLMREHSAPGWGWTAPILPLVVDSAVVIVVRLDATLARLDGHGGPWPVVLRWLTGLFTLALNIGDSALHRDGVGVSVHLVAPALLIVTSEASLSYRRALAAALARIDRERREQAVHEQAQRQAEVERARQERQAEREAAERTQREAEERAERRAREERDARAAELAAGREHEARMAREQADREAAREQAAREERTQAREREQADRERREQQERARAEQQAAEQQAAAVAAAEQAARERAREHDRAEHERHERAAARAAVLAATGKLPEDEALQAVSEYVAAGKTVREIADLTGWSIGWVSTRAATLRETPAFGTALDADAVVSA
ncbi:DUF2637 domain-containing protein [Actinacidiphila yanglinensis]|uniref:DUF2637 domain-containing protein n=1 Tax=Actinacidiphila yanglinensis TaxID=310779 RepID=UPI001F18F3ED|nr:DUF2637 domain-containing protein [Actinacidiphila yanglinensis]